MQKALLAVAALTVPSALAAQETVNLGYNGPPDTEQNAVHYFASNLERMVEDRSDIEIELYPNSQLGSEQERMENTLATPSLNIASFAGLSPVVPEVYVANTPFMFDDVEQARTFFDDGEYWTMVEDAFRERSGGSEILEVVEEGGFLAFTSTDTAIHEPSDFEGLRFRAMDPSQVALYEAMGASGTPIPWTEVYSALQTGVADGQMNPPMYIIIGSLYEVQNYLTRANVQYSMQFLIGNGQWLELALRQRPEDARGGRRGGERHDPRGCPVPGRRARLVSEGRGNGGHHAERRADERLPRGGSAGLHRLARNAIHRPELHRRRLQGCGQVRSGPVISLVRTGLARLTLGLSALLVAWVSILVLYGVGTRYLLGASPIWFAELTRYSIIGSAMIGAGAVWIEGGHMRVGVLEARVPEAAKRVIVVYQWVLTVGLTGGMAWFSYKYVGQVGFFQTQGLQVSRSWPVSILPVGFGLLCLLALLKGPRPLPQPVEESEP